MKASEVCKIANNVDVVGESLSWLFNDIKENARRGNTTTRCRWDLSEEQVKCLENLGYKVEIRKDYCLTDYFSEPKQIKRKFLFWTFETTETVQVEKSIYLDYFYVTACCGEKND